MTSWPSAVEMDVFHQRLADALRDAALDLAVQQHRIDHGADVVDHVVAHDLHLAGVAVDLQLADVAAVRIIGDRRRVDGVGEQAGLHVLRQVLRLERGARELLHRQSAVGLVGREHAFVVAQVVRLDLQHVRGDGARLGDDLLGGEMEGRARHRRGARAAGAFAEEHLVGVALDVLRVLRVDAEAVADDLREGGLVALALVVGAGEQQAPCRRGRSAPRRLRGRRAPRARWCSTCRARAVCRVWRIPPCAP